jgi:hypothetical protein
MLSACGQILNEADLLHFRYGSLVALSTLSPIRYLLRPKTRFPVRRLHLLSGREFHPLEAPGLSWRTIVQVNIGKHWADQRTLWNAPFAGAECAIFEYARFEKAPYDSQQVRISYPVRKKPHHVFVGRTTKIVFDVNLYESLRALLGNDVVQSGQRLMLVSALSEPKGALAKLRLPNRLQNVAQPIPHDPALEAANSQGTSTSVVFADVRPERGLRAVTHPP